MSYVVHLFTTIFLELFYPDDSWLNELADFDHMVKYNQINMAEVGADPEVIVDNAQYPLKPEQREDGTVTITLATYDTKPTHVTNVEDLNMDYQKSKSVFRQHIDALRTKCSESGAWNLAPDKHTAERPLLKTTGEDNGKGQKALTYKDVTDLSLAFDEADMPQEGRVIVLCPQHKADLKNENLKLYRSMMADGEIDGFKIYTHTRNAKYNPASGEKLPMGAESGNVSSLAFIGAHNFRARGGIEAKAEERWADYRGHLVGAQVRFVAMPLVKNATGAIYSDNAA